MKDMQPTEKSYHLSQVEEEAEEELATQVHLKTAAKQSQVEVGYPSCCPTKTKH